jgi:hypothetical protein
MMRMHRSFRAALNEPQHTLGSAKESSSSPYTFRNEDTSQEQTVYLPNNISLEGLKMHVKGLFEFQSDEFDTSSSVWICYPPDGIDQVCIIVSTIFSYQIFS